METEPAATETPPPKILGAKRAALIMGANVLTQLATGFVIGAAVGVHAGYTAAARGEKLDPKVMVAQLQKDTLLPIGVLSILLGTYVVWRMVKASFPGSVREGALAPVGWARCSTRDICLAAATGAALVLLNLFLILPLFPPDAHNFTGPLAHAAAASTSGRYEWAFLAVFLAPPSEEFIFRGVLYTGFSRSWGPVAAAVVVSILFVLMHVAELIGYWPPLIGISTLAAATIIARQRTGSLAAPLALHMTYNLVLVLLVLVIAPT